MPDPIAWDLATKVALRISGREPFSESYHSDSLAGDFAEATAQAEELVAVETGLRSLAGPARARVTDRAGWVRANVASFQRLLRPLTEKLGDRIGSGPMLPVSRAIAGAEVGALLGWMSTRVLGQYDLLITETEHPEDQDIVYYVGPNVLALEKRFGFPPREFRLWLALHEVTHRAQFTGVPWMRPYFLSLVEGSLQGVDPDPKRFVDALRRAVEQVRAGHNPLDDGGLVALLATPEQHAMLQKIQGLMSLLEGHGDITMNRAARHAVPSADRFARTLRQRRKATGVSRQMQKLIGLEAKLAQYEQGERFIETIERDAGRATLDQVWRGPEWLPTLGEIRDPHAWLTRVGTVTAASA